ncbi:MAG: hypothetical protein IKG03_06275 [Clostridiales bacterium]|nr:hypothetical protein [Clostridiales bacterium]
MAFAGMVIGAIFIIIALIIYAIAFSEFIVGIILLIKKKKVPAIILLVLSAIPAVITVIFVLVNVFNNHFRKFETYDGNTVTVNMSHVNQMYDLLREKDMDGLNTLLDKHPELIYFQDINHVTLLEFGVRSCSVDVMEIAYDHGARFDEETVFEHLVMNYSMESFADETYWNFIYSYNDDFEPWFTEGETTDEIIEAAKFAVDHGAETVWDRPGIKWDFVEQIESWTKRDGVYSDKDKELVRYARSVC